jgi:neurotransmitter:Na+ symporter, NSS family
MLFVAAITSSVSMLQPVIAFLEEGFGLKRHASAAVLGLAVGAGLRICDVFLEEPGGAGHDGFLGGQRRAVPAGDDPVVPVRLDVRHRRGDEELHRGAHLRIPWVVQLVLKYVVPVYLLVIFVGFCYQKLPSSDRPEFEASAAHTQTLAEGRLPESLVAQFNGT